MEAILIDPNILVGVEHLPNNGDELYLEKNERIPRSGAYRFERQGEKSLRGTHDVFPFYDVVWVGEIPAGAEPLTTAVINNYNC